MKLKNPIYYGVGALLLTAGIVGAQDGDRPRPPGGPGGEGAGRILEFLKNADKDQDGKLSKDEFAAVSQRDTDERFARMDGNGDGFVDKEEVGQIAERLRGMAGRGRPDGAPGRPPGGGDGGFRRAPDGDKPAGDKPEEMRREGDRPPGDRPEGDRPPGGRPGGPGMGMNPDEVFGRMDANSDGSVDSEEYAAFAKREIEERFKRLDGDNSGTVSKAEFEEGMQRLRQAMGQGRGPGGPGGPGGRPGAERGRPPGAPEGDRGGFRRPPEGGDSPKRPPLEGDGDKKPEA